VDTAVFPENTPGFVLDAFARASLWKIGLDYRHGKFLSLFLHFEEKFL
jgi:Xaa-Pro aminopeptidase